MKKAVIPLWLSVVFSALAIILLLIFYFFVIQGARDPYEISTSSALDAEAQAVLLSYLETFATVDGERLPFSDLLVLWHRDQNTYEQMLEQQTIDFLARTSHTYEGKNRAQKKRWNWIAVHDDSQGRLVLLKQIRQHALSGTASGKAITHIPVDEHRTLRVTLWSEEQ